MINLDGIAALAYEAYVMAVGAGPGKPQLFPKWERLGAVERENWKAVASAVMDAHAAAVLT